MVGTSENFNYTFLLGLRYAFYTPAPPPPPAAPVWRRPRRRHGPIWCSLTGTRRRSPIARARSSAKRRRTRLACSTHGSRSTATRIRWDPPLQPGSIGAAGGGGRRGIGERWRAAQRHLDPGFRGDASVSPRRRRSARTATDGSRSSFADRLKGKHPIQVDWITRNKAHVLKAGLQKGLVEALE